VPTVHPIAGLPSRGNLTMLRSSCASPLRACVAAAVVTIVVLSGSPARAVSYTWASLSTGGDWTTAANWNPNSGYPGLTATGTDVALFNQDLTGNQSVNLDASVGIQNLFLGDTARTSGTFNTTTINTANGSLLTFNASSGTSVISMAGGVDAGTENVIAPNIALTAGTLEFRNNLSSGGGANGRFNLALLGNVTSGTTGGHILRFTYAGNSTGALSTDFRGDITNGPGVMSIFFRKDNTTNGTRLLKLSGTGNTFSGVIDFRGGNNNSVLESSPASGTNGALGTGRIDLGISGSSATLNLGGSLSTVTEVNGINIPGTGARRIAVIGAGNRILSGIVNATTTGTLTLACSNAGNLTISNAINGTGPITISSTGSGKVIFSGTGNFSGPTTVQAGGLQLAAGSPLGTSTITPIAGGTLSLSPYAVTTVTGLLPNAGGLTDVGSGYVTVAAGLSVADMLVALNAGRGDGSWSGTSGIVSSTAAADVAASIPRTVGWLDNGDGSMTFAYAAPGDTNIDWQIDVNDALNFVTAGKFDTGLPATWLEGDFNYDGVVDILDALDFFNTGLYDAGSYNQPAGLTGTVAAVPEPAGLGAIAVAAAAAIALRRRR
jgi:autotransporter-associated beta strand protein